MRNHTDILNYLAKKYQLKKYLEIGIQTPEQNFNIIECPEKQGVEPEICQKCKSNGYIFKGTSDEFFEHKAHTHQKFNLAFIDGLHHADQVKKDFDNVLARLEPGGFIVLHDCSPHSEAITKVPRETKEWTGDCYRFAATLGSNPHINFLTVDIDYGCCVVWRKSQEAKELPEITWEYFEKNRKELLNLVTVEEFMSKL
jgi:precorrin-6B methylase 2